MATITEEKTERTEATPRGGVHNPPERTVAEEREHPTHKGAGSEPDAGRVVVDAPRNALEPDESRSGEKTRETGGRVGEKAREAGETAKVKGKSKAYEFIGNGKHRAANSLESTAQALYRMGDQLRENNQEGMSRYADQASSQIQSISDYLYDHEPDDIMRDVQDAARRQPWITIGGAFIAGLAVARFLKASKRQ